MLWTDFLKVAEELYAILDSKSTEQVDTVVVNAVVQQLREAVSRSADGPSAYVLAYSRRNSVKIWQLASVPQVA